MVPNKINKEKLRLKQAQQTNSASLKPTNKKKDVNNSKAESDDSNNMKNENELNAEDEDGSKQMVGGCCVCADDTGYSNNLLVYCDGCDVAVHQGCYGIINVPDGDWFCKRCEFAKKNDIKTDKINCQLCPMKEGAVKRTDNNKWAHVVCALFIPEISFGSNRTMEPIITKDIHIDRLYKKCSICELHNSDANESILGNDTSQPTIPALPSLPENENKSYTSGHVYVNCNSQGCKHWFHVTCAQSKGLLGEDHSVSQNNVTYCIYCKNHYSKLTSSDIKRIPPFKHVKAAISPTSLDANPKSKPVNQTKSKRKSLATKESATNSDSKTKKTRMSNADEIINSEKRASGSNASMQALDMLVTSSDKKSKTSTRPSRSNSLNNSMNDSDKSTKSSGDLQKPNKKQKNPNGNSSGDISEDHLSNQLNTPPSSYSSSSSTYSVKSPSQKRQRKLPQLEIFQSNEKSTTEISVTQQGTAPLTPPPSVTQEYFLNLNENKSENSTNQSKTLIPPSNINNTNNETHDLIKYKESTHNELHLNLKNIDFKQPKFKSFSASSHVEKSKSLLSPTSSIRNNNVNEINSDVGKSKSGKHQTDVLENSNNKEDEIDEFPKSLDELLTKQWILGNDLISEQSQNFDVMVFLNLLNDCKKENELLEKKLSDLEKSHTYLLNMNEKLSEPLNKHEKSYSQPKSDQERLPPQSHHTTNNNYHNKNNNHQQNCQQSLKQNHSHQQQQKQVFQPIETPNSQLNLPKTPTKQSINSLLISASPISSASSPNNSSLQNISFAASPMSTQKK